MTLILVILIVVCSAILGFFILIQNPKGGGLAGNVGGFSNQFMGVKQTTDALEKGTWICVAILAVLALFSTVILRGVGAKSAGSNVMDKINTKSMPAAGSNAPASKGATVPFSPQSSGQ